MDDRAFAEWLVKQKLLPVDKVRRALVSQRGRQGRLDTEILDLHLMPEAALLDSLGRFHKTRTATGAELEFASLSALRMITPRIASRLGILPFKLEGKTLSVATLSPGDLLVEDEIAQQTGCMVSSFVALEIRFVEALNRHYEAPITARYRGLIQRLSGKIELPNDRGPHRRAGEPAPTPPQTAPTEIVKRRPAEAPRPVKPDDILEISDEDLDLFPSLRQEEGEAPHDAAATPPMAEENTVQPEEGEPVPRETDVAETEVEERNPDELLIAASHAMQNAEMRDDIGDAMLGFCVPLFRRRMMLVRRGDTIMGWRGEGRAVDEKTVRKINIPVGEPSVFSGLLQGSDFWLGPLPTMPRNADLVEALGGPRPKDCFILPVRLRNKVVCLLYGDNQDEGVGGLPMAELDRLAAKASLAFQVYLMKGKIRTL